MPIMIGGGEFIINGAERVVVSQLHRSPGVDFVSEVEGTGERVCRAAASSPNAEAGSRSTSRKESLCVRIDQSGKFSDHDAAAGDGPELRDNANLMRVFYETEVVKITDSRSVPKVEGKLAVGDIVYPSDSERAGEIIVECGQKITKNAAETICTSGLKQVEVMSGSEEPADS